MMKGETLRNAQVTVTLDRCPWSIVLNGNQNFLPRTPTSKISAHQLLCGYLSELGTDNRIEQGCEDSTGCKGNEEFE